MDDKKRITVVMDASIIELAQALAQKEHRSLSGELAFLVEKESERLKSTEQQALTQQQAA